MNQALTQLEFRPSLGFEVSLQDAAIWGAVFERAIKDLEEPRNRRDASRWVLSENDNFGSFRWCCLLFNLRPETIRKKLAAKLNRRSR